MLEFVAVGFGLADAGVEGSELEFLFAEVPEEGEDEDEHYEGTEATNYANVGDGDVAFAAIRGDRSGRGRFRRGGIRV